MWVLVSGNSAIQNHDMLFSPRIFELFEHYRTTYFITGMQAKCKMNIFVWTTIFLRLYLFHVTYTLSASSCLKSSLCDKMQSIQCINSKHHGLFLNIPVVINVNSCFECHLIQFILCVCLNNCHELWHMAGSHIFAFTMKMCLKTLYALFNLRYITF